MKSLIRFYQLDLRFHNVDESGNQLQLGSDTSHNPREGSVGEVAGEGDYDPFSVVISIFASGDHDKFRLVPLHS